MNAATFAELTPTMRELTIEEVRTVGGGDPGTASRRLAGYETLTSYGEAALGGALGGAAAGFAAAGPLGALGFGLLGATYGLAGAGLENAFNNMLWLNLNGFGG